MKLREQPAIREELQDAERKCSAANAAAGKTKRGLLLLLHAFAVGCFEILNGERAAPDTFIFCAEHVVRRLKRALLADDEAFEAAAGAGNPCGERVANCHVPSTPGDIVSSMPSVMQYMVAQTETVIVAMRKVSLRSHYKPGLVLSARFNTATRAQRSADPADD